MEDKHMTLSKETVDESKRRMRALSPATRGMLRHMRRAWDRVGPGGHRQGEGAGVQTSKKSSGE